MKTTLLLAALAALTGPAAAQSELTWSGGVMGTTLTYDLTGPAGNVFALAPSLTTGPTPLAIFDATDPRSLGIGIDLISYAKYGLLTPNASVSYPVPMVPALVGKIAYAQFVTIDPFGGTTFYINEISNRAAFRLGGHGDVVAPLSEVIVARQGHTANALPDGSVLVAGGDEPGPGGTLNVQATVEIFDPQTQTFGFAGTMTQPRSTHTATELADGRILMIGGYQVFAGGVASATAEIYDPQTQLFHAVAPPSAGRTQHTATLLADGRVFVAGGTTKFDLGDIFTSFGLTLDTTEIYDPITNTWTPGPDLPRPRIAHQASLLASGKVLITSGIEIGDFFGLPIPGITDKCQLYDPVTNTITDAANLPAGRAYHGQLALPNGGALVVGGATADFTQLTATTQTNVYTYDDAANAWTATGNLQVARAYPNLVDLGTGLAVLGGLKSVDVSTGSGAPAVEIETADYNAITWTQVATQALPREVARAVAVDDGLRVVIVGVGDDGLATNDKTAEVFIP